MTERSVGYKWLRFIAYSTLAACGLFEEGNKTASLEQLQYPRFLIVFFSFGIASTVYIFLGCRRKETWVWGFDVNPIRLSRWRLSGIEFISSSSFSYSVCRCFTIGSDDITMFWLAVAVGGFISIPVAVCAGRLLSYSPDEQKRKEYPKNFWRSTYGIVFFIITFIVLGACTGISLWPIGPYDGEMMSKVSFFLRQKYGDYPYPNLSRIKCTSVSKNKEVYTLHFEYGKNSGDLQIMFQHAPSGQVSTSVKEL